MHVVERFALGFCLFWSHLRKENGYDYLRIVFIFVVGRLEWTPLPSLTFELLYDLIWISILVLLLLDFPKTDLLNSI